MVRDKRGLLYPNKKRLTRVKNVAFGTLATPQGTIETLEDPSIEDSNEPQAEASPTNKVTLTDEPLIDTPHANHILIEETTARLRNRSRMDPYELEYIIEEN